MSRRLLSVALLSSLGMAVGCGAQSPSENSPFESVDNAAEALSVCPVYDPNPRNPFPFCGCSATAPRPTYPSACYVEYSTNTPPLPAFASSCSLKTEDVVYTGNLNQRVSITADWVGPDFAGDVDAQALCDNAQMVVEVYGVSGTTKTHLWGKKCSGVWNAAEGKCAVPCYDNYSTPNSSYDNIEVVALAHTYRPGLPVPGQLPSLGTEIFYPTHLMLCNF